jgi:hypothetical protein
MQRVLFRTDKDLHGFFRLARITKQGSSTFLLPTQALLAAPQSQTSPPPLTPHIHFHSHGNSPLNHHSARHLRWHARPRPDQRGLLRRGPPHGHERASKKPYNMYENAPTELGRYLSSEICVMLKAVDEATSTVVGFSFWELRGFETAEIPRLDPGQPRENDMSKPVFKDEMVVK